MVIGSPEAIANSPDWKASVGLLLPKVRLDAFAEGTGVDARQIDAALIAGFDLGTLYLFAPPAGSAEAVVRRFRERIVNGERIEQPHPAVVRISGIVSEQPQTLVRIEDRVVAIAVGDPTLARVAEAFARRKLHESRPALRGASLSQLRPPPANAFATFYAPGPFEGAWAKGARGLLANAVALSVSVMPLDESEQPGANAIQDAAPGGAENDRATLLLELAGDFPPSGADDLAAGFRDLTLSSTGKLLGLDQLPEARVRERDGRLLLDVEIELLPIARGLRAAVIADVWEILDLPRTPANSP